VFRSRPGSSQSGVELSHPYCWAHIFQTANSTPTIADRDDNVSNGRVAIVNGALAIAEPSRPVVAAPQRWGAGINLESPP
jgi:hypothetical protein